MPVYGLGKTISEHRFSSAPSVRFSWMTSETSKFSRFRMRLFHPGKYQSIYLDCH